MSLRIRDANPFDVPVLLDMLRAYRSHTPLPFLAEADDAEYITRLLTELMAGRGLVLVVDSPDGVVGMLMAQIGASVWSPKHLWMQELAYWVNPEARGSSAGYRLLRAYVEHGQALKDGKRIAAFGISKMVNSPDLNYERFGFTKLEETWVI